MAPFKKQHGGHKPKGVPNRITRDFREIVKSILEKRLEEVDELIDKLAPDKKLNVILTLLSYAMPKPSSDFTDQERAELLNLLRNGITQQPAVKEAA